MSTKGQDVECANYPTLDHAPYGVKPIVMGQSENGWFTMENPNLTWMIWGYPHD